MDKGKKSFLWLIAAFVAPILIGTLLFFNLERLGFKKGSVNYGTLIQPAFPAEIHDLMQENKKAVRKNTLAKKWTMLYIKQNNCDSHCQESLLLIKRVRLLMNEQMRRVRTVFVSNIATTTSVSKKENPHLVLANISNEPLANKGTSAFLKQFPQLDKNPIYLLDPLGNLMMYYPQAKPNAKKMIKDLLKLLKYSHLG
jgi:cytochrome oxidase Cu insertion factor (SCO1/SenC/PrrC family)